MTFLIRFYAVPAVFLFMSLTMILGTPSTAQADEMRSLAFDGATRHYLVHMPANRRPQAKVPLMLVLHGGGGAARSVVYSSGMSDLADKEKFIVVYPEGSGRNSRMLTWNAGGCCAYSQRKDIDDIGFINALLDDVAARYPVDMHRVYITGMSNGAMMSYRIAGALSNRIAAAGIVAGAIFSDQPRPAVPVPIIIFHGEKDKNVLLAGGYSKNPIVAVSMSEPYESLMESFRFWQQADGCKGATVLSTEPNVKLYRATNCAAGSAVLLYEMEQGGHAWPGGFRAVHRLSRDKKDEEVQDFPASQTMWNFFKNYRR